MLNFEEFKLHVEHKRDLEEKIKHGDVEAYKKWMEMKKSHRLGIRRQGKEPVAVDAWEKRVAAGDSKAMCELADYYKDYGECSNGEEAKKFFAKAVELFVQSAKLGSTEAMLRLAECYHFGRCGVSKNEAKAVELAREAADLGNDDALLELVGEGVYGVSFVSKLADDVCARYYQQAYDKYRAMAEAGNAEAMYIFSKIIGSRKNGNVAFYWEEQAAKNGCVEAMLEMGWCYDSTRSYADETEIGKALFWYEQAAEAGNFDAMCRLAGILYVGPGDLQMDKEKAEHWLAKANLHCSGIYRSAQVLELEESWSDFRKYKNAAENGDTAGMAGLSECYYHGSGVKKDENRAFYWAYAAAELGNVTAMRLLGDYHCRTGGEDSVENMLKWYEKAATGGDAEANLELGNLYGQGVEVKKDLPKAASFYREAVTSDDRNTVMRAASRLAEFYRHERSVGIDVDLAARWCHIASLLGGCASLYGLASCAAEKEDYLLCAYWLDRAYDKGYWSDEDNLVSLCGEKLPEGFRARFKDKDFVQRIDDYNAASVQFACDNRCYLAARTFLLKKAAQGDADAQKRLAELVKLQNKGVV